MALWQPPTRPSNLRIPEANDWESGAESLKLLQCLAMRKFLAIFLLVLLPLQFSWAAVASYCQHESGVTANHPGHHTHDHQAVDQHKPGKDASPSTGVHHDCATCHLGCAAALTSDLSSPAAAISQDHHSNYAVNPSRAHTERPERPQWPQLA